ncbi:hypothetical protein RVR_4514 [Actinacidiphila reveromycinica]|uniref:Uncharacterized protein n=1 Tax=Actinacidiphila reveromycinica TaxID=659352 RepID=A0A7U3UTG6_9ACTN|nr:hypothetical protein [Streptomyces sp. SN-593]BBA98361.1 hypothetical protein RVR_4514 [Streptomyces sp. SN-593]
MSKCCGPSPCNCRVTAGPGVTVDGNGSPSLPYVVSADGAEPTVVQAADSSTVDTEVTGTGTAADPYVVTSNVILDPAPPGGGDQLIQSGPDGLSLECADVRGCFSAGDGAAYDPDTGIITARVSGDAGNATTFGTDGGLFTPAPDAAEPTALEAADSATVDTEVTGTGTAADPYVVTSSVILDPAPPGGGDQLIQSGPDGLSLECADVRGCFSAGDGAGYDPDTGIITARPSTDAGNSVSYGTDGGLYAPTGGAADPTVIEAGDSPTVDNEVTGAGTAADPYVITSNVILDPAPPGGGDQLIQSGPDGLSLECADVRGCFSAGDGAAYDPDTGIITARVSADAGNATTFGTDGGLFTPAGGAAEPTALEVTDSDTVDLTLTGDGTAASPYSVSADVKLNPAPPGGGDQLIQSGPDGLSLECADVRGCFSAGDGAGYDPDTGIITARPSTDAGNGLSYGTDGGLLVPSAAALEVGCGLQGEGTAAAPLAAFPIAGEQPWADDWDCTDSENSTLKCDPTTGALWTPPEHTSAAVTLQQNHPLGTPTLTDTGGFIIVDTTAWSEGTYTADSLTACRGLSFSTEFTGHVEATWTAGAVFDLGYAVSINGGAPGVRVMHSKLQAGGIAGHERWTFATAQAAVLAAHTGYSVRVYPAINVVSGSVTLNQWITDTHLIAITR